MATHSQLFDTKNKRDEAVAALQALMVSEGWQFLKLFLSATVEQYQMAINDIDSSLDDKELWKLKVKRSFSQQLTELPQKIIDDLAVSHKKRSNFDPYE